MKAEQNTISQYDLETWMQDTANRNGLITEEHYVIMTCGIHFTTEEQCCSYGWWTSRHKQEAVPVLLTSEHVLTRDHEPRFWVPVASSMNHSCQEPGVRGSHLSAGVRWEPRLSLSAACALAGRSTSSHPDSANCGRFEGQGRLIVFAVWGRG